MSNRFHSKYHRKNHHTYGNATNPEASHDPIASPDQPFLGDFSLQGALCAVAPLSAYAGYFYSSKTGIRTIGGEIGIAAYSLNTPLSTAFGKNIMHGTVGINKNTITSGYVLDVLGNTNLDGNLNVTGDVDIDGEDLTASTATFNLLNTTTTTINFGGNASTINIGNDTASTVNINGDTDSTSCSTGALVVDGGVGIAKNLNVCGRIDLNNDTDSTSCKTGALIIDGGVGIAKNLNVCGNATIAGDLTVNGTTTYLNTEVKTTSAVDIFNMGTGPALKVTQTGEEPIAHFIDSNGDDIMFANNGKVGLGTSTPDTKLDIYSVSNTTNATWQGGTNFVKLLADTGSNFSEQSIAFQEGANNIGAKIGVKNTANGAYDIIFANRLNDSTTSTMTEKMRITNSGKVGIGETSPEGLLHVKNGSAGTVTAPTNSVGIFENNGNCYISLLSPNENYAGVVMGGPTNPYGSYLSWNHDELDLKLATNHANADIQFLVATEQEAMRISPSGNVGIGITTPTEKLTVSGRVSATGYRANQGSPSSTDASTNGYSFLSDGDTGLFSPIIGGGASNGVVSLFSNNVEKLRADYNTVTIYGNLSATGSLTVNGSITNDPKAPITTIIDYNVTQIDHDKTILANHATNTINIYLPSGLKSGTQVSVIRVGAGTVQFASGTGSPGLSSTPTNDFKKLGFPNSAASAYWTGTSWYLVGDLLT